LIALCLGLVALGPPTAPRTRLTDDTTIPIDCVDAEIRRRLRDAERAWSTDDTSVRIDDRLRGGDGAED